MGPGLQRVLAAREAGGSGRQWGERPPPLGPREEGVEQLAGTGGLADELRGHILLGLLREGDALVSYRRVRGRYVLYVWELSPRGAGGGREVPGGGRLQLCCKADLFGCLRFRGPEMKVAVIEACDGGLLVVHGTRRAPAHAEHPDTSEVVANFCTLVPLPGLCQRPVTTHFRYRSTYPHPPLDAAWCLLPGPMLVINSGSTVHRFSLRVERYAQHEDMEEAGLSVKRDRLRMRQPLPKVPVRCSPSAPSCCPFDFDLEDDRANEDNCDDSEYAWGLLFVAQEEWGWVPARHRVRAVARGRPEWEKSLEDHLVVIRVEYVAPPWSVEAFVGQCARRTAPVWRLADYDVNVLPSTHDDGSKFESLYGASCPPVSVSVFCVLALRHPNPRQPVRLLGILASVGDGGPNEPKLMRVVELPLTCLGPHVTIQGYRPPAAGWPGGFDLTSCRLSGLCATVTRTVPPYLLRWAALHYVARLRRHYCRPLPLSQRHTCLSNEIAVEKGESLATLRHPCLPVAIRGWEDPSPDAPPA